MFKESAILSTISVLELIGQANIVSAETARRLAQTYVDIVDHTVIVLVGEIFECERTHLDFLNRLVEKDAAVAVHHWIIVRRITVGVA